MRSLKLDLSNTVFVSADVGNVKRAQRLSKNPHVRVVHEWEKAVADPDVDVVLIATPDFWHAPMAVRAAENKKHVYVEKALCRTLQEAKAIRRAVKDNKVVLQLGHHQNSDPYFVKAREIYRTGQLGKVALVRTYIDRTSPWPEWQFYTNDPNSSSRQDFNLSVGTTLSWTPIEYVTFAASAAYIGNFSSVGIWRYDVATPNVIVAARIAF